MDERRRRHRDTLAVQAVSDVEEFWKGAYRRPLDGHFQPATAIVSWDSTHYGSDSSAAARRSTSSTRCTAGKTTTSAGTGAGCFPRCASTSATSSIPLVLGHEYGHAIQRRAQLAGPATPSLVAEQQADCFAGVYMRWVAEGRSPRFTLNTGEGLNSVLATVISLRDPMQSAGIRTRRSTEHGSAFERISAFQLGFTDGPSACAAIDKDEVEQRRGDLPVSLTQNSTGEWPVTEESVKAIVDAMTLAFSPANPPTLSFDASAAQSCRMHGRARRRRTARPPTPSPWIFRRFRRWAPPAKQRGGFGLPVGDNTAYSVLVSRYMLALEKQRGAVLDNAEAALRTACLTRCRHHQDVAADQRRRHTVQLAAGDLDEAVSGMLTNGLAASDVNGASVPSGFSRIDAFRTGVLGDEDRCFKRYP